SGSARRTPVITGAAMADRTRIAMASPALTEWKSRDRMAYPPSRGAGRMHVSRRSSSRFRPAWTCPGRSHAWPPGPPAKRDDLKKTTARTTDRHLTGLPDGRDATAGGGGGHQRVRPASGGSEQSAASKAHRQGGWQGGKGGMDSGNSL